MGGEYKSNYFYYFSKDAGIKREFIVPYNPHENDIVAIRIDPS